MTYQHHPGVLPQDAVPVLWFCAEVAAGQEMAITDPAGNILTTSSGSFGPATWPEGYISCAQILAEIQELTGTAFPLPDAFTAEDQRDMNYALMILRGEDVHTPVERHDRTCSAATVDNLLAQVEQHGEPFMFAAGMPETPMVAGGQLPLGSVLHVMHSTRIVNLDEVKDWRQSEPDGNIDVSLEPGGIRDMTVRAGSGGRPGDNEQPLAS